MSIGRLIGFVAAVLVGLAAFGQPVLAAVVTPENRCCSVAPRLTKLGNGSFRSQGGLVYGPDPNPSFASRVDHVLAHGADDLGRPIQAVFSGDALALTDEAWSIAQDGGAVSITAGTEVRSITAAVIAFLESSLREVPADVVSGSGRTC